MTTICIAYYTKEQYDLLLKYADDRKKLDDKWEDWLMNFIKAKNHLQNDVTVKDLPIDVEKMQAYFKANKLKNTGESRAKYTSGECAKTFNN